MSIVSSAANVIILCSYYVKSLVHKYFVLLINPHSGWPNLIQTFIYHYLISPILLPKPRLQIV